MPTVPSLTPKLRGIRPSPIATVFDRTTGDVSGAAPARGLARLGGAVEQVSDVAGNIVLRHQIEDNERMAKELDAEFTSRKRELLYGENGFYNQQGRNAVDAAPAVKKQLDELRQEILKRAQNDRVGQMLAPVIDNRLNNELVSFDRFTNKERVNANVAASSARVKEAIDDAATAWNDPNILNQSKALIQKEVLDQAEQQGHDPEVAQSNLEAATTEMYRQAIIASMKTGNTSEAKALLNKHRGEMDGPVSAALDKTITDADRIAQDRAGDAELRAIRRNEYLRNLAKDHAAADAYSHINSGRPFDEWLQQNPELLPLVASDGNLMSALERREVQVIQNEQFANTTDPSKLAEFRVMSTKEKASVRAEDVRTWADANDYETIIGQISGARDTLDDEAANFPILSNAHNVLRDKAPASLQWNSKDQDEENRQVQQSVMSQMDSFIISYQNTEGKNPSRQEIIEEAERLMLPIITQEQSWVNYLSLGLFGSTSDAEGLAAELGGMTPEQRKTVKVDIEKVRPEKVEEARQLHRDMVGDEPSDSWIEEFFGAELARDGKRQRQLLGID